ncbi:thiamine pyrophosphokinase [Algoriphagus namhaensis]
MSSHHFVKEQQEPAVFILSADSTSLEQIGPLLEWVPTVLVTEEALPKVLSWGIKIDLLLASADFQKVNLHLLEEQYPIKFLTTEKESFLEDGLRYLQATDHKATHLVGYSHLNYQDLEKNLHAINLTVLDEGWKYYPVSHGRLRKWFSEQTIRVLARENLPLEVENSSGKLIFPVQYLSQLDLPEGITTLKAPEVFWIGERVG